MGEEFHYYKMPPAYSVTYHIRKMKNMLGETAHVKATTHVTKRKMTHATPQLVQVLFQ